MKKLLAASLLAATFATPAFSADMAVKAAPIAVSPAYDWSGFYFGGAVGGRWTTHERMYPSETPAFGLTARNSQIDGAAIFGVQKQFGVVVIGLEGTWNNNSRDVNTGILPVPPFPFFAAGGIGTTSTIKDLVTVGGRVGYAGWTNWLLYGEAGYAHARLYTSYFNSATGAPLNAPTFGGLAADNGATNSDGWFAGGGVDYLVYKGPILDVIVGGEYQHIDVSSTHLFVSNYVPAAGAANYTYKVDPIDIVRARLTFKFNPFGAAPAAVVAKY